MSILKSGPKRAFMIANLFSTESKLLCLEMSVHRLNIGFKYDFINIFTMKYEINSCYDIFFC